MSMARLFEGSGYAELGVAHRIVVQVMDVEQKGGTGLIGEVERFGDESGGI